MINVPVVGLGSIKQEFDFPYFSLGLSLPFYHEMMQQESSGHLSVRDLGFPRL